MASESELLLLRPDLPNTTHSANIQNLLNSRADTLIPVRQIRQVEEMRK